MEDAVEEAPWCRACRRSSELKWKKHVFTKKHQAAAQRFLRARAAELAQFCEAVAATQTDGGDGDGKLLWRCRVCEGDEGAAKKPTSEERRDCRAGVDHFASPEHRRSVEQFCRWHRSDHERQIRAQLWLTPDRRRQLVAVLEKQIASAAAKVSEAERVEAEKKRAWKAEAFLSSATARLQEVQREWQVSVSAAATDEAAAQKAEPPTAVSTFGPLTTLSASRVKTAASRDGVLQNPLGRHDGERVWGGGIIKLKGIEKITWGIDILVKEEQVRRTGASVSSSAFGDDGTQESFAHRMTDMAYGGGLGTIARVDWATQVGNVHTGAVPPWMVDSEDDYKKRNSFQGQANDVDAAPSTRAHALRGEKPKHDPNWLPNFGGVWESGPRSKTKLAFQQSIRSQSRGVASHPLDRRSDASKPRHTPRSIPMESPRRPSTAEAGRTRGLAPAVVSTDTSVQLGEDSASAKQAQATALPPGAEPVPPVPSTAVPPLPPGPLQSQPPAQPQPQPPSAALDSKKLQLLAQKERLRAKFAARKQR